MTDKEETESKNKVTASVYKFAIIENITTMVLMCSLFAYTQSGWCFLLLINLNQIKKSDKK